MKKANPRQGFASLFKSFNRKTISFKPIYSKPSRGHRSISSRTQRLRSNQIKPWAIALMAITLFIWVKGGNSSWNLPSVQNTDTGMQLHQLYSGILPNLENCQEGILKQDEKDKVLKQINQIRALHQLPPVRYAQEKDVAASKLALAHAANVGQDTPINPNSKCWSTLIGKDVYHSTSYSVYYSASGTRYAPAMDLIRSERFLPGMLQDSRRGSLSARRLLLNPFLQSIAFARTDMALPSHKVLIPDREGNLQETVQDYVSTSAIVTVDISEDASGQVTHDLPNLVAYPFGDYPKELFQYNEFRNGYPLMSVSIVLDRSKAQNRDLLQIDFSIAQVQIRDPQGKFIPVNNFQIDHKESGLSNFLSWSADTVKPDVQYTVQIKHVRIAGEYVDYEYSFCLK